MQQRHASLLDAPVAFAHRGARAHAPENTLEAFALGLRLGANGLETDAWLSADGKVVLDHDGIVRRRLRKRSISGLRSEELPAGMPLLDDLFTELGTGFHLSIDLKDPSAVGAVAEVVASHRFNPTNLWLCSPDTDVLGTCHGLMPGARLVHTTRLARLGNGVERHCHELRERGITALNLRHTEWNGGTVVLCHRFGVLALAWDVQYREHMESILLMGIDGLYSDHVDLMADCFGRMVGVPRRPA
ncbi:MAG: glycerophosphodiester phosphodiesterase [Acidimicrobiales bacterium]